MITLHGRTRKEGFTGLADWEMIGKMKEILEIPLIANGDIKNGNDAINCIKITKADGVMIGRGVLGKPWLIGEIDHSIKRSKKFKIPSLKQKLNLIIEHLEELMNEKGEHGLLIARKHISWSCKNFKDSTNLRSKLVKASTPEEVKYLINKKINTLKIT